MSTPSAGNDPWALGVKFFWRRWRADGHVAWCQLALANGIRAMTVLLWLVSGTYSEEPPTPSTAMTTAHALERIVAEVPGQMGYLVAAVDGTTLFSRHADEQFPQASAIKIPLLMEVIAQREQGTLDWHQQLAITRQCQVGGSGVLDGFSDGHSLLCLADLCQLMITVSDNTATNLLIDRVGMDAVNRRLDALGCPRTRLRRVMMDMAAAQRGDENVATPAEAARIMQMLARGEFQNPAASNEILDILRLPKTTAIRKAIPDEIVVASKPGGISGVATEWALVELPRKPYVLILMGKEGDEAQFRKAFTQLALAVHEHLATEP